MPKALSREEIIKRNPKVDEKRLLELSELEKKLSEIGAAARKYQLASPVVRRRVIIGESDQSDPRTIHLGVRR